MSNDKLIQNGFDSTAQFVKRHLPTILSETAKVLAPLTVVATYKKAPDIHNAYQEKMGAIKALPKDAPVSQKAGAVVDLVLSVGKEAAVPGILLLATEGCIHGAEKEYKNRIALLGGALVATQVDKKQLKETVQEVVGKKKAAQIDEKAAEKKFRGTINPNDPTLFDDANMDCDCIFMEENTGTVMWDNYLSVQNYIQWGYDQVRNNKRHMTINQWFEEINDQRVMKHKKRIKIARANDIWEYNPSEYKNCNDIEDFMMIVPVGNMENGARAFLIKSTPSVNVKVMGGDKIDEVSATVTSGMPTVVDEVSGDGVWQ